MKYIESKEEHSATDHAYWEKQTFFDLDDPEILPLDSGRIEWLVEGFNGRSLSYIPAPMKLTRYFLLFIKVRIPKSRLRDGPVCFPI